MLHRDGMADIQISVGPKFKDSFSERAAESEVIAFDSLDGTKIEAILYRPKNIGKAGTHPVIVNAHGGSRIQEFPAWRRGFGYPTLLQYFASRGYFVLNVNYRSGTGYGLDFREPDSYGGRGAGDVQDFVAAARYLKGNVPEIDPKKFVIFGHSYGGHIVSNVLARTDEYAAGISSAGVGDWVVEMEMDSGTQLPFNLPKRLEIENLATSSSAISAIENWGNEPILFLHGDYDRSAALQQTIELYLALKRRGKDADALIVPGEAHRFILKANQFAYMERIESFLGTVFVSSK
jgi:dipeptidyl aminopeptidase/acylaminoacyl peptidase